MFLVDLAQRYEIPHIRMSLSNAAKDVVLVCWSLYLT